MTSLKAFLSPQYLFTINSVLLAKSDKVFFVLGGCLFVLGLGLRLFAWRAKNPINKKLFRRSAKLFATIGILEVLWFGMRYENVRFFGTHFVALLCLLIGLVWLGFLVLLSAACFNRM
jgi:Ca2+/Na+ antiporter